ncbi:50S ribosomal protein L24 [Candidatus Woesearchaeota archaeon]|nr:50S ribosomal protein L24 [Candidatus Woesearchaeota archaeon]
MKEFSTSWKSSKQIRKQRKYRYNAPLHLRQKFLSAHLSADLRKKYGVRSIQLRKGDKVKILRGQFAKRECKVERITLKRESVFLSGVEVIKKDGNKVQFPLKASSLMIIELDLSDKKRKMKLEQKKPSAISDQGTKLGKTSEKTKENTAAKKK